MDKKFLEESQEIIRQKGYEVINKFKQLQESLKEQNEEYSFTIKLNEKKINFLNKSKEKLIESLSYIETEINKKNDTVNLNSFIRELRDLLHINKNSNIEQWGGYVSYQCQYYFDGQLDGQREDEINGFYLKIDGKVYNTDNLDIISLLRKYHIYAIQFSTRIRSAWGGSSYDYYTQIRCKPDSKELIDLYSFIGDNETDYFPDRCGNIYQKLIEDKYYEEIVQKTNEIHRLYE